MYQNHVIDPSYFYDAIEQFAFNYKWYVIKNEESDEFYRTITHFDEKIIRGSLQSQGTKIIRSKEGNITEHIYEFYCKSLYKINEGDFILYNNSYLIVTEFQDYDEWGVRSCVLKRIQLSEYKDFSDYIKYLNGEKII